jgi:hypothetical protein
MLSHNLKVVGSNPTPATKNTEHYQILSVAAVIQFASLAQAHQRHINTTHYRTTLNGKFKRIEAKQVSILAKLNKL